MAEELKERKAFEAHMRVGGHSNHDKHPDGSYVSSAMELWWQGWKARAQLPSQGGEAVEVVAYIDDGGALYTSKLLEIMSVESDGCEPLMAVAQHQRILAAATHPADQVADDLSMVKVSRELLERALSESTGDLNGKFSAREELRALLNGGRS